MAQGKKRTAKTPDSEASLPLPSSSDGQKDTAAGTDRRGVSTEPAGMSQDAAAGEGHADTAKMPTGKSTEANVSTPQKKPPAAEVSETVPAGGGVAAADDESEPSIEKRQELYLPVHGFVWLHPEEVMVIDHPAFQRLAQMNQLGQAYLVYRGATHRRIEHVLGTLHMVHKMAEATTRNARKPRDESAAEGGDFVLGAELSPFEIRFARLGALLHDVGHVPWGHTIEDELQLLPRHDGSDRLEKVFSDRHYKNRDGLGLAAVIDREYQKFLPRRGWSPIITPSILTKLLICKNPQDAIPGQPRQLYETVCQQTELKFGVLRDMIGNTICADLLDYLYRDWFHIGKGKHLDDRILHYMEIRTRSTPATGKEPTPTNTHNFVISLGKYPRFRTDAVSIILELLETRYQLAEAVYFHRTKLTAAAMLERALSLLFDIRNAPASGMSPNAPKNDLEQIFITTPEDALFDKLESLARSEQTKHAENQTGVSDLDAAAKLLRALNCRQLFDLIHSHHQGRISEASRQDILSRYNANDVPAKKGVPAVNRAQALHRLERDCGLPVGSIAMYCPDPAMNAKIAEVKVYIGSEEGEADEVLQLQERETRPSTKNQLTGGHLSAQIQRFQRLWKVVFFIDEKIRKENDEMLPLIRAAIDQFILGQIPHGNEKVTSWKMLATQFATQKSSPYFGRKVKDQGVVLASKAKWSGDSYPLGAPPLNSWFEV